jgi:plastocyanin
MASGDVSAARSPDTPSTTTATSSSTSSAPAQTHTIQVGLADHKFKPDEIKADVGDVRPFYSTPLPMPSSY